LSSDAPPSPRSAGRPAPPPLFRQPAYVALLLTALVSNTGSWMQGFSEQWLVVQLAGAEAPRWTGRLGFASGLAMLVLMPFGGALGDRFDRRRLLALCQGWLAAVALAMGVLALLPGGLTLPRLVIFAAATGVGLGLNGPVLNSLFPSVIPPEQLTSASGYMSAQFNLSRIIGPSLAAMVMAVAGVAGNFLLNAVSFLGLITVAFRLPPSRPVPKGEQGGSYLQALRRCREDPQLRVVMVLSLFAGTFAWSYHTFVTVYAVRYLHVQAGGAASLLAAYGVGAIVGALYLSRDTGGPVWRRLRVFLGAYGGGLVLIGLLPHHEFSLAVAASLGASHAVFGNLLSVLVQRRAPEAMRGRITALYFMAVLGTTPLGNLAAGEIAQRLGYHGVRWVLGSQGVILIGAAVWAALRAHGSGTQD
jgi:MFS family permease